MRKIPSLFVREPKGDRRVTEEVQAGCEWVIAGEGWATEKYDGSCCLVQNGRLFKRFDANRLKEAPPGWIEAEPRSEFHWFGWVPVSEDEPSDKWHREAWQRLISTEKMKGVQYTCELVGPKVQGNPYLLDRHELWVHGDVELKFECARTYHTISSYLENEDMEGLVFYHPDGRRAKVKRRDFGLPWPTGGGA